MAPAPELTEPRVFLHIGAPKTGTTFLQAVLWKNRAALAEAGVCYPLQRPGEHFDATMDLRGMAWGGERKPEWEGAWARLAARVRSWGGPVSVLSNELLGGASAEQAASAVASLAPVQVHVVFTARDLARQLPSDWQEQLKHRKTVALDDFVADCVEHGPTGRFGRAFWRLHDAAAVLERWGSAVPADRIHVVTVPQPDAPPGVLWQRFASVLGVDAGAYDSEVARPNSSLGLVQCELLRRVNEGLTGRLAPRHYDPVIRINLAETVLGRLAGSRPALPAKHSAEVQALSEQQVADLTAAGYHVVGDLAELDPGPQQPAEGAQVVSEDALLSCAVAAVAGLIAELDPMRERVAKRGKKLAANSVPTSRRPALLDKIPRRPARGAS
jgi:hypothetical protein